MSKTKEKAKKTAAKTTPATETEMRPFLQERRAAKEQFAAHLYKMTTQVAGWGQSELARRSELGRDLISNYVRGKNYPSEDKMKKIADAFDMSVQEFLSYDTEQTSHAPAAKAPIELRQLDDKPGRAWLAVNREVSFSLAAKIIELINAEDNPE